MKCPSIYFMVTVCTSAFLLLFAGPSNGQTSAASEVLQGQVPIKGKPSIPLAQTLYAARPILCDGAPCDPKLKPKLKPKDICITAICLPIEPKVIPKILGPDALHWRIKQDGSMAQFIGSTQLSNYAKTNRSIPLDARAEQIRELPIVGLKGDSGGNAVQYWVRVK
jgi:hypothetical protein